MKKFLTIIIGCIALFNLTGCSSTTNNNGAENSKTSFNINEPAVFENVHYTVTNVEYSNGDEWDKPAEGNEYVIVTIKIENKSDSKISYNAFDWTMLNSQGQEDSQTFSIIDSDTNLGSGDLMAGGTKTGTLIFEQNRDETNLKLLYYSNLWVDENPTFEIVIK